MLNLSHQIYIVKIYRINSTCLLGYPQMYVCAMPVWWEKIFARTVSCRRLLCPECPFSILKTRGKDTLVYLAWYILSEAPNLCFYKFTFDKLLNLVNLVFEAITVLVKRNLSRHNEFCWDRASIGLNHSISPLSF